VTQPPDPRDLVEWIRSELTDAEELQRAVETRVEALRQMLAGAEVLAAAKLAGTILPSPAALVPTGEPTAVRRDPAAPRGSRAARLVLEAGPESGMTLEEIYQGYVDRGWVPETAEPLNAIRAALSRLRRDFEVGFNRTTKVYRLYSEVEAEAAADHAAEIAAQEEERAAILAEVRADDDARAEALAEEETSYLQDEGLQVEPGAEADDLEVDR
jgi:hypothetical protein